MNHSESYNFNDEDDDEEEEEFRFCDPLASPATNENPLNIVMKAYSRRLKTRPILTKAITCSVVSALGALIGNLGSTSKRANRQPTSPLQKLSEVCAFALYGGLVGGPMAHHWNEWLNKNVEAKSTSLSLLVDQLIAQPPMLFLMHVVLDMAGAAFHELPAAWNRSLQRTPISVVNSWRFWPAAVYIILHLAKKKKCNASLAMQLAGVYWMSKIASQRAESQPLTLPSPPPTPQVSSRQRKDTNPLKIALRSLLLLLCLFCTVTAKTDPKYVRGSKDKQVEQDPETLKLKKKHEVPTASMTVPMHYESGSHHIYIYVGSPKPQRQTLILDTGSRYMAFPCEPCPDCGHHASALYFNDANSTTHRDNYHPNCVFSKKKKKSQGQNDNSCIFDQTYLEGSSWTAKEVEDLIWLATSDEEESIEEYMPHLAIPFTFGCQTHVTGYFVHQYSDGILGMGKQTDPNSLLQVMVKAGAIDRAAFAMCLSQTGGTLSFGGSGLARPDSRALEDPEQYHLEPMQFSRLTQDHGLYALDVYKVLIGDVCITCDNTPDRAMNDQNTRHASAFASGKGTLLDSGTTDTYFPRIVDEAFKRIWENMVGSKMVSRRRYTYEEFLKMPIITVIFNPNATLHAHPCSYMEGVPMDLDARKPDVVQPWEGSRQLTMRIYMEEAEGAVLGANFMYNYDVLYDLERNRVGFARANCGFDRAAQEKLNKDRGGPEAETKKRR